MNQQAFDLQQLAQAREMQRQGKLQMVLNIATQLFAQGRAESFDDAFTLAEQFIDTFEKRYTHAIKN